MLSEVYHPTRDLADNLFAVGEARPGGLFDAHHIIPGKGRWQQNEMLAARLNLHLHGIGINDPVNGVYLPKSMKYVPHWRFPKALPHANIHTFAYEQMVNDALTPARSADAVRNTLLRIRAILEQGSDYTFLTQKASSQYEAKINKLFAASAE